MSKNIFRQKRTTNFTVVPNEFLQSSNLSFKAKGILSYLLSLPPDWEVHVSQIANLSKDGRDSVSGGITELIEAHYIWRRPRSGSEPGGWEYFVYDAPQSDCPFPNTENPNTENPESGKPEATKKQDNEKRTKETKDTRTTEEFVSDLKRIYDYIDIDLELKRIDAWLLTHPDRKKTRRFVTGWLNRIEKPMEKQKYTPGSMLGITKGYRPCL